MVARILLLVVLALLAACSSPPSDPALDPIFVVLCADDDPEEPPHPCCTGFALSGQVVTANHCVPDDTALLVSRHQWLTTSNGSEIGHVLARDERRDIAWLSAPVEAQIERGPAVASGAAVSVLTMSGVKPGTVGERAGAFWLTDLDTLLGDSGAGVVDASGNVVGVLSRCLTADGKQCDPRSGIFAELP